MGGICNRLGFNNVSESAMGSYQVGQSQAEQLAPQTTDMRFGRIFRCIRILAAGEHIDALVA